MSQALEKYLDRVMVYANLREDQDEAVRNELRDHLLEKIERLGEQGVAIEDAVFRAIEDHGHPRIVGHALRPKFPWLDVRSSGTARGFIAIGPRAVGVFAFGGLACGVVSVGGLAVGVFCMGGMSLALLFCWAGMGIAGFSYAGLALGVVAVGGLAAGVVTMGPLSLSLWSPAPESLTRLAYYTSENVPALLTRMDSLLVDWKLFVWLTCCCVPLLLVAVTLSNLLQYRERRRIQYADPYLVE